VRTQNVQKRSGGPFLMARRTAKLFGYNGIFDVYYFHGEGRDSLEKRGLFFLKSY